MPTTPMKDMLQTALKDFRKVRLTGESMMTHIRI